MQVSTSVLIRAPRAAVWTLITDIEHAPRTIRSIESVEILERPSSGLVRLKWRETRTLFGKSATETMWITEAVAPEFYKTRAESHGAIYLASLELAERGGATELAMHFSCEPVTGSAKLTWRLFGWMFRGATLKACAKDLADIKAAAESAQGSGTARASR